MPGNTIDIDTLRRRLDTTRASIDEWLFLCRSFDREDDRVSCADALLVVFAVRLRQYGVRPAAVSRAVAELLSRPGDALADEWVAIKRPRQKDVEFAARDAVDLTALRRTASVGVFTAAEMREVVTG